MTLQQAVFAGFVDPGNIVAVREITASDGSAMGARPLTGTAGDCGSATPANCDTSFYSQPSDAYTITKNADGSITVADNALVAAADLFAKGDGVDTLWNIENLRFCTANDAVTKACTATTDIPVSAPAAPTAVTAIAGVRSATVNWSFPTTANPPISSFQLVATTSTGPALTTTGIAAAARTTTITGLTAGRSYTFQVRAVNTFGQGALSVASNAVVPLSVVTAPTAPTLGAVVAGNAQVTVNWTPPTDNGGSPITRYDVRVANAATNVQIGALRPAGANATSPVVTGLTNGTAVRVQVRAVNVVGASAFTGLSAAVTPATVPTVPQLVLALGGLPGGAVNATVLWAAPANTGGSAITNYRITAINQATGNATTVAPLQPATAWTFTMALSAGTYRFTVQAINAVGSGPTSPPSNAVVAR
jgi:predicted phage tail protein